MDYFFRPTCFTHRLFNHRLIPNRFFCNSLFNHELYESDSDEEEKQKRSTKNLRKNLRNCFMKQNPNCNQQSFCKSYYSKTTLDKEGKPITYSYQNQTENHYKDGHKYIQRTQTIKNGEKEKQIIEKQLDNKIHKVIKTKNEKGENVDTFFTNLLKDKNLWNYTK